MKNNSSSGNWTLVSRVSGGDIDHYTNEDWEWRLLHIAYVLKTEYIVWNSTKVRLIMNNWYYMMLQRCIARVGAEACCSVRGRVHFAGPPLSKVEVACRVSFIVYVEPFFLLNPNIKSNSFIFA